MKKLISLFMSFVLVLTCICIPVFADSISVDEPDITRRSVTISGTYVSGARMSLMLSVSQNTSNIDDVIVMQEKDAGTDGKFTFTFTISDVLRNGQSSDAKTFYYIIGAENNLSQTLHSGSFEYYIPIELSEAITAIDNCTTSDGIFELLGKKSYKDLLNVNGVIMDIYTDNLTETEKKAICQKILENKISTEQNFKNSTVPMINEMILCYEISNNTDENVKTLLDAYDYKITLTDESDYKAFADEEKDYICLKLENTVVNSFAELSEKIDSAHLVYGVNNTVYQNMHTFITNNAAAFNLSNDNLNYLNSLSAENRNSVYKNFKNSFAQNSSYTKDDVASVLSNAISTTTFTSSGSGSSSGGGGGSRGSGSVTLPNTPVTTQTDYVKNNQTKYFDDLEDVEWAKEAINYLYEKTIIRGTDLGVFEPNRNITRAECLKMMLISFDFITAQGIDVTESGFSDVVKDDWYFDVVVSGVNKGVVSGYEDGSFRPNAPITREEMVAMFHRIALAANVGFEQADFTAQNFTDQQSIADYAFRSVLTFYQHGLVSGMGDGTFAPQKNTTRAEASVMVYNLLNKILSDEYLRTDIR